MQQALDHLRDLILRHAQPGRRETGIPGLRVTIAAQPTQPASGVFEPMLCLIVQGAKRITIGERELRYDPACYFVASVGLPATGCICEASPDKPYIGLTLAIDRTQLAELLPDAGPAPDAETEGFLVDAVTPPLLDGFRRLVDLLDTPDDIPVLAPMIQREILYRLLRQERGGALRAIACADSRLSQVARVIGWIRGHYDTPLRIDDLAGLAGMSRASLHRHFKAATTMSPLQFQKVLRLQEARRLLFANPDAQSTAYRIGYESASQFSREYARLFGLPPVRDAERLRAATETGREAEEAAIP